MKNKSINNNIKLYICLLIGSITIVISSLIFLYANTLGASAPPEFITLNESSKINFKAYLTDSKPFGKDYLDKTSDNIPKSILDYFEFNFDYIANLSSSTFVNFYDSITLTLTATQNKGGIGSENNPIILNRIFPFCKNNMTMERPEVCPDNSGLSRPQSVNSNFYNFTEKYILFLEPYLDFVTETTASYIDYPINVSITIEFQMATTNNDKLRSISKRSITIPITESNFLVQIIGEETQTKDFYAPERTLSQLIVLIGAGVIVVTFSIVSMVLIKKLFNKKTVYRKMIDNYLRDYDDAIINTSTKPNVNRYSQHIMVENFKELLNMATSTGNPIVYYETEEYVIFYIVQTDIFYYIKISDNKKH